MISGPCEVRKSVNNCRTRPAAQLRNAKGLLATESPCPLSVMRPAVSLLFGVFFDLRTCNNFWPSWKLTLLTGGICFLIGMKLCVPVFRYGPNRPNGPMSQWANGSKGPMKWAQKANVPNEPMGPMGLLY